MFVLPSAAHNSNEAICMQKWSSKSENKTCYEKNILLGLCFFFLLKHKSLWVVSLLAIHEVPNRNLTMCVTHLKSHPLLKRDNQWKKTWAFNKVAPYTVYWYDRSMQLKWSNLIRILSHRLQLYSELQSGRCSISLRRTDTLSEPPLALSAGVIYSVRLLTVPVYCTEVVCIWPRLHMSCWVESDVPLKYIINMHLMLLYKITYLMHPFLLP